MSSVLDFLAENPIDNVTEEVIISKRLKGYPFKIKAMTETEYNSIQKLATVMPSISGGAKDKQVKFDSHIFNTKVILNHCTEPNFKDSEAVAKANCRTPEEFLCKSLLAGEITELTNRIMTLSGFNQNLDELTDDVKND